MNNILSDINKQNKVQIGDKLLCWQTGVILPLQLDLQLDLQQDLQQDPQQDPQQDNKTSKLEPRPLAFLYFLAQHPGQVVTREQLLEQVWGKRHVSDDAIRGVVKKLREALGDNAKSPTYIKTVPLKGYILIAAIVEHIADQDSSAQDVLGAEAAQVIDPARRKPVLSLAQSSMLIGLALLFAYFSALYVIPNNQAHKTSAPAKATIERLTYLPGEEHGGDYSEALQTLVFSYQNHEGQAASLYQKHLPSEQVKRLSFDSAGYYQPRFSPDASQLAYDKLTDVGVENMLARYSANGLTDIISLSSPSSEKAFLSWSADGASLYFRSYLSKHGSSEMSVIYRYHLKQKRWQQITFPHVKGEGDLLAEESPDGRYLAVIRNTADRRYSILILDLLEQKISHEHVLPFVATKLVWLDNKASALAMSSYKGDLYSYSLAKGQLSQQQGTKPGLNDIFYACGKACFYMRQHGMNQTDIIEIPNPFEPPSHLAVAHYNTELADFHPVYNATGNRFYFSSKEQSAVHLMRRTKGQPSEKLFSIKATHIINQLSIHPDEHFVAGKIEGRAFIYQVNKNKLTYITSQEQYVNIASWDRSGQYLYFSRVEQGRFALVRYNVDSEKIESIEQDIKGRYELKDGRDFVIDHHNGLYQQESVDKRKFIATLPESKISSWQILNEFLYFVEPLHSSVYINRLDLNSGDSKRKKLFEHDWVSEFSLHVQGHKMLVTKALSDNSNLVKVQWPMR
jgi:transcriptional activator of cad operon